MAATGGAVLEIGDKVGEYEVTGALGEGGMGAVYAGVHPVIGKTVAIKVLKPELASNPEAIARFVQEARSVNQIGHKNIIDIFAFGELPSGAHYFVMELLSGVSLADRIRAEGPYSVSEALEILDQVADGLEAAHAQGIFHRDLKPDNIYLVPERRGPPTVKLLDFGLAKLSDGSAMVRTRTGVPMGTPLFMPPEQWEGKGMDHRTDIYALGVILHNMLTGRYPFEADSFMNLMFKHVNEAPELPSRFGAPAYVDSIVARALAKPKEVRFQSVRELCDALRAAQGSVASGDAVAATMASGSFPAGEVSRAPEAGVAEQPGAGADPELSLQQSKPGDYYASPGKTLPPSGRKRAWLLPVLGMTSLAAAAAAIYLMSQRAEKGETGHEEAASESAAAGTVPDARPAVPSVSPAAPEATAEKLETGTLLIVNSTREAAISLDGRPVELTGRETRMTGLPLGRHVVRADAPRRESKDYEVDVRAGEESRLEIALARAHRRDTHEAGTRARSEKPGGKPAPGSTDARAVAPATSADRRAADEGPTVNEEKPGPEPRKKPSANEKDKIEY